MAGILFILSAPSGSGKSTLVTQLRSLVDHLEFSISYTTRPPRGSETDGREYHFITRDRFESMIAAGDFFEHAEVFGNYYGTARRSLADAAAHGNDLLLDIDVQGAAQVRARLPEALSIFILPPNPAVLSMRLHNRSQAEGSVDPAVLERRLAKAREEIANYREYGYILVNDILDKAVAELSAIVLAERTRRDEIHPANSEYITRLADSCRRENSTTRLRPVLESFGFAS